MEIKRRETRSEVLRVRVGKSLRREAEAAAVVAGVTLSDLLRAGLTEATENVLRGLQKDRDR